VTLRDFKACFPYDDFLNRYVISGKDLWKIFSYIMRKDNRNGEGECYQVNSKVRAVYDDGKDRLKELYIEGQPVDDKEKYKICLQGYHFNNSKDYLGLSNDGFLNAGPHKVITTSAQEVLEEFLRNNQNISRDTEGRLTYI
jgi:5'-nucleotidase